LRPPRLVSASLRPVRDLLRRLFSCQDKPRSSHRHPRRLCFSHRVGDLLLCRPYLSQLWLDERVGLFPRSVLPFSRGNPPSHCGFFTPPAPPQQRQRA